MLFYFDAAALLAKGYRWALVRRYGGAAERGTIVSKHRSEELARKAPGYRASDTGLYDLRDLAELQAEQRREDRAEAR
jgi:hypothetical protein